MRHDDLALVRAWLGEPHVARWFLAGTTLEDELAAIGRCLDGLDPTRVRVAESGGRPVGWGQWYRCADEPEHARGVGAGPDEAGIDYAVGDPGATGRGLGTALVTALVDDCRAVLGPVGVVADPEAANVASRRALERSGFRLVAVRRVVSEALDAPMAVYRLPAAVPGPDTRAG